VKIGTEEEEWVKKMEFAAREMGPTEAIATLSLSSMLEAIGKQNIFHCNNLYASYKYNKL